MQPPQTGTPDHSPDPGLLTQLSVPARWLILIALSWAYLVFGQLGVVAGMFYGIKPAIVAIVLHAALRIGQRALKNRLLWGLALASFIALAGFGQRI